MEKPFPGESALRQSSQAIHPSERDGRAAGALSRGHVESRPWGLTGLVFVFGFLHPHGSLGWGCNLLEDWCCWVLEVGDVGQCKP